MSTLSRSRCQGTAGFWASALLGLAFATGCGSRDVTPGAEGAAAPAPEGTTAESTPPAPELVRVRGIVTLAQGADLPEYTPADIGRAPLRGALADRCPPARESDVQPMRLGAARGVGGLLVTATGDPELFAQLPAHEPRTIPLTIRDCRLEPSLVVAVVGDRLELVNRSPIAFITRFTTDPINEAVAPERTRTLEVVRNGVQRVECMLGGGCGRTDVVVLAHRAAVVTDAEGRFELDVPAGAEVVLHAWHPLLGRRSGEARLTAAQASAGATHTLDIELNLAAPAEPSVPVAPAPAAPGGDVPMH